MKTFYYVKKMYSGEGLFKIETEGTKSKGYMYSPKKKDWVYYSNLLYDIATSGDYDDISEKEAKAFII